MKFYKYLVIGHKGIDNNDRYIDPVNIWVFAESEQAAIETAKKPVKRSEFVVREVHPLPFNKPFEQELVRQNEIIATYTEKIYGALRAFVIAYTVKNYPNSSEDWDVREAVLGELGGEEIGKTKKI